MTYDNWVCIEQAHGQLEGEILRAKLEANNIPVQVFQESAGVTYGLTIGSLGLVKIFVPKEYENEAIALISTGDQVDLDLED
jgi:hypothetical protein